MKQVDFYLLKNAVNQGRFKLASRLSKKLQSLQQKSLIVLDSKDALVELDSLLWSFSDTSFVAHHAIFDSNSKLSMTHLAQAQEINQSTPLSDYNVLINLSSTVPSFSHHFARTVEVIESDEDSKASARNRFRHYKSEGFEVKTHNIEL